ncbi:MAG: hypothetical protein CMJ85_00435 [Planctomycetes bacterium]|jgi:hypothetical protein|nr:hypothetical protein [Planctomycetota bacterium]
MSEQRIDPNRVKMNLDQVVEHNYSTVPAGTYLCRVDEARPGLTRTGHARWAVKYVVHEGPEAGRLAAWDGLAFSPNALSRTCQVLAALGMPHRGEVELQPLDLVGRLAFVKVEEGAYRNPSTGEAILRNRVPFEGIQPADIGRVKGTVKEGPDPGHEPSEPGDAPPTTDVPF